MTIYISINTIKSNLNRVMKKVKNNRKTTMVLNTLIQS